MTSASSASQHEKWVYAFGNGSADGDASMGALLGGKGANLAEMASLGLPIPPGFTITTDVCAAYYVAGKTFSDAMVQQIDAAVGDIGRGVGSAFGDAENPLLISVRSGARASMPGMMDTILNLGLNDTTVEGLATRSGDRRFAWDSYRRFIQMYGDVVLGVEHELFEDILDTFKQQGGVSQDTDLTADDLVEIVDAFKTLVAEETDAPFPQDLNAQLWGAISAVFLSWKNVRANTYRRLHGIPDSWGTAVNVQAMVFGNMGDTSATGVAFTRNPSSGENSLYGEFLVNAQGEDVVAGIRTPQSLTEAARLSAGDKLPSLETVMPEPFDAFCKICETLEAHYRDMQDIEFTVQDGKLWILQTRSGKRTTEAALKIAVDMAESGLITKDEAVLRIDAEALDQLLHPTLDPDAPRDVVTTGLPASPGAACGEVAFSADEAESLAADGKSVLLVRTETSPEDIHGMVAAVGILTTRGGMTSHAAVVARGMGRPCVSGAGALSIDRKAGTLTVGQRTFKRGDILTIDGTTGQVLNGRVPTRQPELSGDFATLMTWADAARTMAVRANADTPGDAKQARDFGAEGIGLCRTEHMFFESERIQVVREMILADDEAGRRAALDKLLPMQRDDFVGLFAAMDGLPVTIRLLDPPLHEFLPEQERDIAGVASSLNVSEDVLRRRISSLEEFNPMLGFRGCRLAIAYPEIPEMQARAIFEAMIDSEKQSGTKAMPEIMIPLIVGKEEYEILETVIRRVASEVEQERGVKLAYMIGTMIELPRACLKASEIAERAEFFSFGTNDLTQTAFGLSRDDAGPILSKYTGNGVFERDPFVSIDQDGVGELVKIGIERGRASRPDIKLGICGEHGGDPRSVTFCHEAGLDYVSCSPYRVPIARLAAAQAALRAQDKSA